MSELALLLPDLGFEPLRAEVSWWLSDGAPCAPRQPVASIAIASDALDRAAPQGTELRALLLAPCQGTLHPIQTPRAGWGAHFPRHPWTTGERLATLDASAVSELGTVLPFEVAMVTLQRLHPAFEDRRPYPGGPYRLAHGWWGPHGWSGPCRTLLSLGNCEQLGLFAGNAGDFSAWLGALAGPLSIVYKPDRIVVPSAGALLSALQMDDTTRRRAAEEFGAWFHRHVDAAGAGNPTAWLGSAALAQEVLGTPVLRSSFALVDGTGQCVEQRPAVVFLSLASELAAELRHRKLGYTISVPAFHFSKNPDIRQTLLGRFELVRPSVTEIGDRLRAVIAWIRRETGARVVLFNLTSQLDRIWDWSAVDRPSDVLSVRLMDLNLAAWDLARQDGCDVVDVEALALDVGLAAAYPDGVHPSAELEARVRSVLFERVRQA
jgi:hypothetical protein